MKLETSNICVCLPARVAQTQISCDQEPEHSPNFGKGFLDNKRGLSPVIATVLLVAMVLVLATIIFIWARSFIGEKIQKEGRDIDLSCKDVEFNINAFLSASGARFEVDNIGTVSIYGLEIRKKRLLGESVISGAKSLNNGEPVYPGESGSLEDNFELTDGDEVLAVPILIGTDSSNSVKSYVCDGDFGREVTVV